MKFAHVLAACALVGAAQQATAGWPLRKPPCPVPDYGPYRPDCTTPGVALPPGVIIPPGTPSPTTPPTTTPPTTTPPTTTPPTPDMEASAPGGGFGDLTASAVGGDYFSGSLQMYGDAFGGRPQQFIIPRPTFIPGRPAFSQNFGGLITVTSSGVTTAVPFALVSTNASQAQVSPRLPYQRFGQTFSAPFTFTVTPIPTTPPAAAAAGDTGQVLPNAQELAAAAAFARGSFGPGGTTTYLAGQSFYQVLSNFSTDVAITTNYNYSIPGVPDRVIPQPVLINVPSPTGGGVVGRTKVADDNSPLPRDRVIFNYDYFNSAALAAGGVDVHRFSPGIEKTFFDGLTSVEVRVPFAATLDNNVVAGGGLTSRNAELGNVNLTLKALLYRSRSLYVASGLGIALPTADDVRVRFVDGTDLVRLRNDAVLLTPYLAVLCLPTDRLFIQTWGAVGFDANGNRADANFDLAGLRRVGRLNDQSLAQVDAQLGYWLVRSNDPNARLQGLAPFVELHYNATIQSADVINAGAFRLGSPGSLNELNLSAGLIAQIGANFNLSAGIVVPLKDQPDRTFDYQIGIRGSYFFGRTARANEAALQVSGF